MSMIDPLIHSSSDGVTSGSPQPDFMSQRAAPCKHFRRGKCKFGNLCMFSHSNCINELEPDKHESDDEFWANMAQSAKYMPERQWCAFE